jgi:hypothetical protein
MEEKTCSKCSGLLIRGLIVNPGAIVGARWQEESKINKWFNNLTGLPTVIAYKCSDCGLLENYVEDKS